MSLRYDEAIKDIDVVNTVRMMTVRTRFIDEALEPAVAGGATQVVAGRPTGSSIVFDFTSEAAVDMLSRQDVANVPPVLRPAVERTRKMTGDQPWVFGLPSRGEREFLAECGLELRDALTVGGEEAARRYLTKADGAQVGAQAIAEAMARMREYMQPAGQSASVERTREQEQLMALLMAYQLAEAVVRDGRNP